MFFIILSVGIIFIVGIFYIALHNTQKDVTKKLPFSDFMDTELPLKREAVLVKNTTPLSYVKPYLLVAKGDQIHPEITEKYDLPIGATIRLGRAVAIKNAVSGFSTNVVVGTIYVDELKANVEFEYVWGKEQFTLEPGAKRTWKFPLALWQEFPVSGTFTF